MQIGNRDFDVEHHTYIMGILNVTPDSFSDGGFFNTPDKSYAHCEEMIADGASIIDVGGESTKPGYTPVTVEQEIERIAPVIEGIKKRFDIPVSIDTSKSAVAEAAVKAGCDLINDIWGFQADPKIAEVTAKNSLPCVIMHNRRNMNYTDFLPEVIADLSNYCEGAVRMGISKEKIIVDPGVGFAKTYEQNLEVIRNLEQIKALGYPVLLGTSRKSVIGLTLDLPIFERVEGTIATTVMAVEKGCAFVRVHDVKENARAVRMTEAILGR